MIKSTRNTTKTNTRYLYRNAYLHSLMTGCGIVMWTRTQRRVKAVIRDLILQVIANKGNPDSELLISEEAATYCLPTSPKLQLDMDNPRFIREANELTKIAVDYLDRYLMKLFYENAWFFLREAITKAFITQQRKDIFPAVSTELEIFNLFFDDHTKTIKKRLAIRKESGQQLYWTEQKKSELAALYFKYYPLTKEAKSNYKKLKTGNWVSMIAAGYPDLPREIINNLDRYGQGGEPKYLVLEYLSSLFNNASPEYMVKKISEVKT